jgi:hypothetical protein
MSEREIKTKLQWLMDLRPACANHRELWANERDVVYLMVELRKALERNGNLAGTKSEQEILKFFADWSFHDKKEYIPDDILRTLQSEFAGNGKPTGQLVRQFRVALQAFLQRIGANTDLVDSDSRWNKFMLALASILREQPIKYNPTRRQFGLDINNDNNTVKAVYTDESGAERTAEYPILSA